MAIETEVKSVEKKVSKIKAVLLSKEIFDFSPEEHLKHGEVRKHGSLLKTFSHNNYYIYFLIYNNTI